nr:hypothetical protein [Pandoravirus aubagnensis]
MGRCVVPLLFPLADRVGLGTRTVNSLIAPAVVAFFPSSFLGFLFCSLRVFPFAATRQGLFFTLSAQATTSSSTNNSTGGTSSPCLVSYLLARAPFASLPLQGPSSTDNTTPAHPVSCAPFLLSPQKKQENVDKPKCRH